MKWIILMSLIIFAAISGSLLYNQYIKDKQQQIFHTNALNYEGTIQSVSPATDDFTHLLITASGTLKLTSQRLNLNDYVGKKVKVIGQFSGSTFFVDAVEIKYP